MYFSHCNDYTGNGGGEQDGYGGYGANGGYQDGGAAYGRTDNYNAAGFENQDGGAAYGRTDNYNEKEDTGYRDNLEDTAYSWDRVGRAEERGQEARYGCGRVPVESCVNVPSKVPRQKCENVQKPSCESKPKQVDISIYMYIFIL